MKIQKIYEDLQYVVDKVPKINIVIIFGDQKTKLEKEREHSKTLHDETNRNGEFAFANNTIMMMSIEFQYKQIHKETLIPPDQNIINQRDYILLTYAMEQSPT